MFWTQTNIYIKNHKLSIKDGRRYKMVKYIAKKICLATITILLVTFFLYLILECLPHSPFYDKNLTQAQTNALQAKYKLDQSFIIKFKNYLGVVFTQFDLGVSYFVQKNANVSTMIAEKFPFSIFIMIQAMVLGSVFGLGLGVLAAYKHDTRTETICTVTSVVGMSVPAFVLALILQFLIGFKIGITTYNPTNLFLSSILPSISISIMAIAIVASTVRLEMINVLHAQYMLFAESKGLPNTMLIFKHALKNALLQSTKVVRPMITSVITGSIIVEEIFSIPGIGALLIHAIRTNDYNVIVACILIYSILYIGLTLIVDIVYGFVNPRFPLIKRGRIHG